MSEQSSSSNIDESNPNPAEENEIESCESANNGRCLRRSKWLSSQKQVHRVEAEIHQPQSSLESGELRSNTSMKARKEAFQGDVRKITTTTAADNNISTSISVINECDIDEDLEMMEASTLSSYRQGPVDRDQAIGEFIISIVKSTYKSNQ